jgi:5-methylcytosine-specific restriction endonuclease McrA
MYNILKLHFDKGEKLSDIVNKYPQHKSFVYQSYKKWRLDKYNKSSENLFYHSPEYKFLRLTVLKRDGYKCTNCGKSGSTNNALQLEHIKPKSLYPELIYELSNLRILCINCHKKTESYGKAGIRKIVKSRNSIRKNLTRKPKILKQKR